MKYFAGEAHDLGHVSALPQSTFAALCAEVIENPIRLPLTRAEFFSLPKKDKEATSDQSRVKRVRYITPATFKQPNAAPRQYEHAERCNLIAIDVDSGDDARRLLKQNWAECFGDLGYVVWKTVSSTTEAPRLRVVVNAEGITRERYRDAVRTVAEMIGLAHVTTESRVTVQPMFLPTVFADTPADESPIVASNPTGDAFLSGDIVASEESGVDQPNAAPVSTDVADIEYLRTPLEGVTLQDAEDALKHLDPDMGMQQWIEVAAGLKHQFNSDDAYVLWDAWSAKGKKYVDAEETRYRWQSLKANPPDRAPITIRSVFKQAQARGWNNAALAKRQLTDALAWIKSPSRSSEELLDQGAKRIAKVGPVIGQLERKMLMVALKGRLAAVDIVLPLPDIKRAVREMELEAARTTGIPPWAKGLCFITSQNMFYRHTVDRYFTPEVLDLVYSTPPVGDEKQIRPREYVVQIVGCPVVENVRYCPSLGGKRFFNEDGVPYVNTYRPSYAAPNVDTADQAGEVFMEHVRNLIREEEHQQTLVDFLAYHVQHPGKKIRWAVVIQSAQGAGKTFIQVVMSAILGRRNVTKLAGSNVLGGEHNDWAYGSQMVVIEEVRVVGHNRYAVMDKLKPCISDDEIALRAMYDRVRTVPNIANYLMFTNYHDSLAIQDDDRRYFVLASPLQRPAHIAALGGAAYFNRIFNMVRDNASGLRAWFEQWPISKSFEPEGRAPVTKYLHELAENSATPLAAEVRNCIEDEPHALVRNDLLSVSCLRASLSDSSVRDFSDQALANVLRELGWSKHARCMVDGAKHQLWVKREMTDPRATAEARLRFL